MAKLLKHENALFYVRGGVRRRVAHPEAVPSIRDKHPGIEVEQAVDTPLVLEFGARVPRKWRTADWIEPPEDKQAMREIIVSRIEGKGIEFGAGSRPMPIPFHADVDYVEPFQSPEQYERMGYAEVVRPKYSCPIEDQHEIPDGSQDFVVAAHVIEHTPNPIRAIVECYRVLRGGGQMVLVVPDKRKTFDRQREDTALEHLLADFDKPDRQRDFENYLDFYRLAKRSETPEEDAQKAHAARLDIHYHVWTPGSFAEMMQEIRTYAPFRAVEVKPGVADPRCLEFYVWALK